MRHVALFLVIMAFGWAPAGTAWTATFTVGASSDADCADFDCDLQSALDAAAANAEDDVVQLSTGTFTAAPAFVYDAVGAPSSSRALLIEGAGLDDTVLLGGADGAILSLRNSGGTEADLTVRNLTVRGVAAPLTPSPRLHLATRDGDILVQGCAVETTVSVAARGALLESTEFGQGAVTVQNSRFAGHGGGGLEAKARFIHVEGSRFTDNSVSGAAEGAGLRLEGSEVTVTTSTLSRNTAGTGSLGGGLYIRASGVAGTHVMANHIEGNTLGDDSDGGGAYLLVIDAPARIEGNVILNNQLGTGGEHADGGGLLAQLYGSMASILAVNNIVAGNLASAGGGVFADIELGDGAFVNNTFVDNYGTASIDVRALGIIHAVNNALKPGCCSAFRQRGTGGSGGGLVYHHNYGVAWGHDDATMLIETPVGNIEVEMTADELGLGPDHRLRSESPLVDAGLALDPRFSIPAADIDGDSRPFDGDGDGEAGIDIGADELVFSGCGEDGYCNPDCVPGADPDCATSSGIDLTPDVLTFYETIGFQTEPQLLDLTCVIGSAVTVTAVSIEEPRELRPGHAADWRVFQLDDDAASCATVPFTLAPGESCSLGVVFEPLSASQRWWQAELVVTTNAGVVYASLLGSASPRGDPEEGCCGGKDCATSGPPSPQGMALLTLLAALWALRRRRIH